MLHLLDKYSKTVVVPKMTYLKDHHSLKMVVEVAEAAKAEVATTFDKEYWKDKTCYNCGEKGHPSSSCMKAAIANENNRTSIVQSVKKHAKDTKNLKKASTNFRRQQDETRTCLAPNQKKRICTFSWAMDFSSCK
jgi:hypothetical protein